MPQRRRFRRPVIFDGAVAILESGLYDDLTVDALARSLHMSKTTLYRHFPSKEDLVLELLDELLHELEQGLAQQVHDTREPRAALRGLVELCARHAERLPRAALTDVDTMPAGCREKVQASRQRMAEAFREVLSRGKSQGQLQVPDPTLTAEALCASSWAAMMAAARGDLGVERGDAVRQVLPLFRI